MRAAGICITEAGLRAVAQFEGRAAKLSQRRPRIAIEITPAGLAAMRDYELAHATAQGAEQVPGAPAGFDRSATLARAADAKRAEGPAHL